MIQKNKFGLIWSCILKVINFLIFRDFSRIFSNFSEFILNLFIFQIIQIFFIYHVDVALRIHVKTLRRMRTPRAAHVRLSLSVRLSG